MSAISSAFYALLSADANLVAMLATYRGAPAIFTVDPPPADAVLPYVVTAGEAVHRPFDTKTTRGREIWRDVRCYAAVGDSAVVVEAIADRVRTLLHRAPLSITGYDAVIAECIGPIVADEIDAYGRILTARITMMEV